MHIRLAASMTSGSAGKLKISRLFKNTILILMTLEAFVLAFSVVSFLFWLLTAINIHSGTVLLFSPPASVNMADSIFYVAASLIAFALYGKGLSNDRVRLNIITKFNTDGSRIE